MAQGISPDHMCSAGLVCLGNQCIALACTTSADCQLGTPYCVPEQGNVCEVQCTKDPECPGFGQDMSDRFCVQGDCVQCRTGTDDCAGEQACIANVCGPCTNNAQCPSGLCTVDGTCAAAGDVAFTGPTASSTASCTQTDPCSLAHAVSLATPPHYVLLAAGTYTNAGTLVITGQRTLIGAGSSQTIVTCSGSCAVFNVPAGATAEVDAITMRGATGAGITSSGTLRLVDDVLAQNASSGLSITQGSTTVERTTITGNPVGLTAFAATVTLDRDELSSNGTGISISSGVTGTMTNTFVFRNSSTGISLNGASLSIAFSTIVDNGPSVTCSGGTSMFANDIIDPPPQAGSCTYSRIYPQDSSGGTYADLHFKSTAPPYDYHLGPGSIAIDAATSCTVDHDFDGDARPLGAACDIGADEAQ